MPERGANCDRAFLLLGIYLASDRKMALNRIKWAFNAFYYTPKYLPKFCHPRAHRHRAIALSRFVLFAKKMRLGGQMGGQMGGQKSEKNESSCTP